MNEKVASGAFLPPLNVAIFERVYDNVSIISSHELHELELLFSASQYKMDIDTFHFLSIIDILASRGI